MSRAAASLTTLTAVLLTAVGPNATAQVSPGPNVGTREQYRACLDDEEALRAQRAALLKNTTTHNTELKRLQSEIDALVATQDQVMAEGGESIKVFNTKLEALNARAQAINRLGDEYDREQADHNARAKELNARCAGLPISFKDRDAVFTERAAARAKAKQAPRAIDLNQSKPD
jgi:peptidoglycan hydrolase CwlO-like protein